MAGGGGGGGGGGRRSHIKGIDSSISKVRVKVFECANMPCVINYTQDNILLLTKILSKTLKILNSTTFPQMLRNCGIHSRLVVQVSLATLGQCNLHHLPSRRLLPAHHDDAMMEGGHERRGDPQQAAALGEDLWV